jgi:phosphinothricin acetyltransferase
MNDSELLVRVASPADAAAIAKIYAPFVLNTAVSFETSPPDEKEMSDRITKVMQMYPWLVAEAPDGVAGYAYASCHRDRSAYQWGVNVTVYLDPNYHRKGIGRQLYQKLFEILRTQGFTNAFAGIALPNDASIGLHRAMGFELVGVYKKVGFKLGKWHDTSWWQLSLGSDLNPPSDPVSFRGLNLVD